MGKVNYLLLDMSVLPEVYVKVIEAKGYLQSGEAANASQAIKMAGISCSAYYKYKEKGADGLELDAYANMEL